MLKRIKRARRHINKAINQFMKLELSDSELKAMFFKMLNLESELDVKETKIKELLKKGEIKQWN